MNKDQIKGNWDEIKGKIKSKWAMVGENDYSLFAEGKMDEFSGKIQKAYGKSKDEADKELNAFAESCGCSSSDKAA